MKKIKILLLAIVALAILGCENEIEPGGTKVQKLSNEWWGQLYVVDTGNGELTDLGIGYIKYLTFSTASNRADSMFIDDLGELLELKAKVGCNTRNLTFNTNGTAVLERYTDGTVIIANGKVLPKAGRSTSGVVVDSIYFEAVFDWDPTTTYAVAGHARTGFAEDEH